MGLKLALLELETGLPNLTSQALLPMTGVLSVGTAARAAGHDVSVFVERLNGVPEDALREYDVVGLSISTCSFRSARELCTRLRRERPDVRLVAGGAHATLIPNDVLELVDVAVRDEGEETIVELLESMEGKRELDGIAGISYRLGGAVRHNPRRRFIERPGLVEDLDLLRGFRRRSVPMQLLRQGGLYRIPAATSRGCPFQCSFCFENMIGGTSFRRASIPALIEDVRRKADFFGARDVWLGESNFTADPKHAREVLQAIIDADLGLRWSVPCRIDVARHPDLLPMMREAGFDWLLLGMESLRDEQLTALRKEQTLDETRSAIRAIRAHDIGIFGLFMVGFDDDTAETPHRIVDFCDEHDVDAVSIFCLAEYPSLPGRSLPRHRVCDDDLDYYSGHFVVTFPKSVRPSVLEREVFRALERFYSPGKCLNALARRDWRRAMLVTPFALQIRKLGRISARHRQVLESREARYYDGSGQLDEALLRREPWLAAPLVPVGLGDWRDPVPFPAPAV